MVYLNQRFLTFVKNHWFELIFLKLLSLKCEFGFSLLRLSTTTHHNCYVKLIISSLNYTLNSYPRQILAHTLQCKIESSRLYATQFLNVILRARQHATEINNRHNMQRFFNSEIIEPPSPSIEVVDTSRTWSQNNNCPADVCLDMDSWILELLVKQTRDQSKAVSLCALTILDEACNVPVSFILFILF